MRKDSTDQSSWGGVVGGGGHVFELRFPDDVGGERCVVEPFSITVEGLAWPRQKVQAGRLEGRGSSHGSVCEGRQHPAGVEHSAPGTMLPNLKASCLCLLNVRPWAVTYPLCASMSLSSQWEEGY